MSRKRNAHLLLSATLLFLLNHCHSQERREVVPAFYYWKTTLQFDQTAASLASGWQVSTLYLRYFDIDWNAGYGEAVPAGVLSIDYSQETGMLPLAVIPTVFITNRTFEKLPASKVPELAEKTYRKIQQLSEQLAETVSWERSREIPDDWDWERRDMVVDSTRRAWLERMKEIQIDCDWTATTRDKFFLFLQELKKHTPPSLAISCTLRLHQYRDRKLMGIPPVERVALMCYNTGAVKDPTEPNAILREEVVDSYLSGPAYPLKMDLALPLFHWAAWYRGNNFQGILRELGPEQAENAGFLKAEAEGRYLVSQDTVVGSDYLREGDLLRIDGPRPQQWDALLKLLSQRLPGGPLRVAFFDWNFPKIKQYETVLPTYWAALR